MTERPRLPEELRRHQRIWAASDRGSPGESMSQRDRWRWATVSAQRSMASRARSSRLCPRDGMGSTAEGNRIRDRLPTLLRPKSHAAGALSVPVSGSGGADGCHHGRRRSSSSTRDLQHQAGAFDVVDGRELQPRCKGGIEGIGTQPRLRVATPRARCSPTTSTGGEVSDVREPR